VAIASPEPSDYKSGLRRDPNVRHLGSKRCGADDRAPRRLSPRQFRRHAAPGDLHPLDSGELPGMSRHPAVAPNRPDPTRERRWTGTHRTHAGLGTRLRGRGLLRRTQQRTDLLGPAKHLAPHAGRPDRADAGPSDRDQRRRRRPAVLPTRQATLRAALSLVGCGGRPRRGVTGLYGAIRSRGRPDGRDRRCRALPR
jgi:hypothetical protein